MRERTHHVVQSPIGKRQIDNTGAAIGVARMNPAEAYDAIPLLLKEYINSNSEIAWEEIKSRIDKVYITVSSALEALDAEAPFSLDVMNLVRTGKKLFFKPNLVGLPIIDPDTHGPMLIGNNTPWEFLAAVMRWFHDKCGTSYYQMAVGEAGSATSQIAFVVSKTFGGRATTTQALFEGKCCNNYGGWGFYFARKYLAECHDPSHTDDPMNGYEESISGACLPPGEVHDRLIIYDLNKIANDLSNGRDVPVVDGINYKTITLHKAIIGGDPNDPEDIRRWPGCVLVNVCKLKIHDIELFTGATKNLGMGLYSMEINVSQESGKFQWKYAIPHLQMPLAKWAVPHTKWVIKVDEETLAPIRGKDGDYVRLETGGLEASIADSVQAVKGQGVMMLHIVDAIEPSNISHTGPRCTPVPEGFVFASTDMVAVDTCASRYLFTMVPLVEVERVRREYSLTSDVIQKVPIPKVQGKSIVDGEGYDSPYSRSSMLKHCEGRGLGQQKYYLVGNDLWHGGELASLRQHLGRVDNGVFTELFTSTLYHSASKPLWDLQATCMAYLRINDKLTGSDFAQKVLQAYDENGDSIIDYMETGKSFVPLMMAYVISLMAQDLNLSEASRLCFLISTTQLKHLKREWNAGGHNLGEEVILGQALAMAFAMSNAAEERIDPFFPEMTWGKGKWPSMQFALHRQISTQIFGYNFPNQFDLNSPYGCAFNYADNKWNGAKYVNALSKAEEQYTIGNYHKAVAQGANLLPFTIYVPQCLSAVNNVHIPNVEQTDEAKLIFTASFNDREVWQDLRISSFHLK
jgi:hypothetical protein